MSISLSVQLGKNTSGQTRCWNWNIYVYDNISAIADYKLFFLCRLCHQQPCYWLINWSLSSMENCLNCIWKQIHDDVIKWKQFPRYWPFVRGIHRAPVNSPHKGQWRGALIFSLICARINGWVNNHEPGDFRRHRTHCDVTVMIMSM